MTTLQPQDLLAEIWEIKDALSAAKGHDLKTTCRALYAEQEKRPGDYVNLGASPRKNLAVETAAGGAKPPGTQKRRLRAVRVQI